MPAAIQSDAIRNRGGFFSDYFIGSLQDERAFKGLLGEPSRGPGYNRLRTLYRRQCQRLGEDSSPAQTRRDWLLPLFELLGFHDPVHGRPLDEGTTVEVEGAAMRSSHEYVPEGAEAPACLIDLLAWGQGLDESLPGGLKRLTPHRRMQALLDAGGVRWGLLANGEAIRLVRQGDEGAGQQFLEVAFEPMLLDGDEQAFASFWALYGARAFIGEGAEGCLLDRVQQLSAQRGTGVSQELGVSVVDALGALMRGLLERSENWQPERLGRYLTRQGDGPAREAADLTDEDLRDVYRQGLVFLFRMLFVLYAESRGLLPVDVPAYAEQYSIETLRDRLWRESSEWHAGERRVWTSLRAITRIMREGLPAAEFHVPAFDGRLFAAEEAPLLECCAVGDDVMRRVMLGLTMTRPKQGKAGARGVDRISYRELGVDQLGAVYEGLLEFEPRVAQEPIHAWWKKEKGRLHLEVVRGIFPLPLRERARVRGDAREPAVSPSAVLQPEPYPSSPRPSSREPVGAPAVVVGASPSGGEEGDVLAPQGAEIERYEPGQFYLDPTGGARKGSGTYYTPREFTSVLVEQALGPQVEGKSSEELLKLRVLDPAMGSGAFLIAACEFLAERYVEARDREARDLSLTLGHIATAGVHPSSPTLLPQGEKGATGSVRAALSLSLAGEAPTTTSGEAPSTSLGVLTDSQAPLGSREGRGEGEAQALANARAAAATDDEEWQDRDARLGQARRLVAERCLYGVDKNPMAVQLAHVSLWLTTLSGDRPLTFLDHHLRCGDSLAGATFADLEQPVPDACLSPEARKRNQKYAFGQQSLLDSVDVRALIETLLRHREELAGLDETVEDVRRKDRLLHEDLGESRYQQVKDCLDLWCSLWFWDEDGRQIGAPLDTTQFRDAVNALAGRPATWDAGKLAELRQRLRRIAGERRFFHWELEFPELFWAPDGRRLSESEAGFDAVLGNPPFLGGKKISGSLGDDYRRYLLANYPPAGGLGDLCVFFYRRAFGLLPSGGRMGMLATGTISEGDTREGGLAVILKNAGAIVFAKRFVKWPGEANVEVNLIVIHKGSWDGPFLLDGRAVPFISSQLDAEPEAQPARLAQNAGLSFQGSIVLGMGFVLEPEEAAELIDRDARNGEVLFPYLNGEDLNSRLDQSPSRWVINFHDWPLERADEYPDCMTIVREKVKPERDKLGLKADASAGGYAKFWWQYARRGLDLYATIAGMERVLVRAQVSELHMPVFVPKGLIYSMMLVVFAFDDGYHFALLQSNVHEVWVWKHSSSLESRNRYTPTDCFETFPFPQAPDEEARARAGSLGDAYHEHRRQIMLERRLGLTKTYNLFNAPDCDDADIARLRELHAEMDRAILACYGWQDLDPKHDFYKNERGKVRYTIAPEAARELRARLLALNLELATSP